ncbi:hypothetical protein DFO67_12450 [Modicisalibacter xianhensis]|uniref:Uncharacterized protein n=1 Tax=Modicisalibacter xianhensis TaxID=442341 RepID=A0A4V3GSP7_9GAMM|nr:hypothetical protein DFO67_12450 [Halomonas xianhensis]
MKKDAETAFLNEVSSVPLQQCLCHKQTAFKYREGQLFLAKCKEPLAIRWSRQLPSGPTTVTVSRDSAGRYFVSCLLHRQGVFLWLLFRIVL